MNPSTIYNVSKRNGFIICSELTKKRSCTSNAQFIARKRYIFIPLRRHKVPSVNGSSIKRRTEAGGEEKRKKLSVGRD